MIYLFLVALSCYVLMQSIETISFSSRVAGKLTGRIALGTTLQTSIFTMSRLFLPPLLLSISYMIESELSIQLFLLIAITLVFTSFFVSLLVLFNLNTFQSLFQKLFFFYQTNSIPVSILKVLRRETGLQDRVDLTYQPKLKQLSFKKMFAACFS